MTPALASLRLWGLAGGINAYLTPAGAVGKPPHVDDHDVLVLHLSRLRPPKQKRKAKGTAFWFIYRTYRYILKMCYWKTGASTIPFDSNEVCPIPGRCQVPKFGPCWRTTEEGLNTLWRWQRLTPCTCPKVRRGVRGESIGIGNIWKLHAFICIQFALWSELTRRSTAFYHRSLGAQPLFFLGSCRVFPYRLIESYRYGIRYSLHLCMINPQWIYSLWSHRAGIPHHAAALPSSEPSLHLAVALHRRPMAWSSVLGALVTLRCLASWMARMGSGFCICYVNNIYSLWHLVASFFRSWKGKTSMKIVWIANWSKMVKVFQRNLLDSLFAGLVPASSSWRHEKQQKSKQFLKTKPRKKKIKKKRSGDVGCLVLDPNLSVCFGPGARQKRNAPGRSGGRNGGPKPMLRSLWSTRALDQSAASNAFALGHLAVGNFCLVSKWNQDSLHVFSRDKLFILKLFCSGLEVWKRLEEGASIC